MLFMAHETYDLTVVSPMFLNGATPNQPEFRAASVRGQLRYWLRAIEGAKTQDLKTVREQETKAFGSTSLGSTVSIRIYSDEPPRIAESLMLPHRAEKRSPAQAIKIGQPFKIDAVTRPGTKLSQGFQKAFWVWLLLGGMGKRSRRMFGAIDPFGNDVSSPREFIDLLKKQLNDIIGKTERAAIPIFPTLHPAHSWVMVGQTPDYTDPQTLIVDLFRKLLRIDKYRNAEHNFGYTSGGRRASPLIAQMRKVGKNYLPVLTVMRSNAPGRPITWGILNDFMKDAIDLWGGETVWGGELK